MTKRQERKRKGNFTPIIGQLHASDMNRRARRAATAGKNPYTSKGGLDWRKRAWLRGMPHGRRRTCSYVDRAAVRVLPGCKRKFPILLKSVRQRKD